MQNTAIPWGGKFVPVPSAAVPVPVPEFAHEGASVVVRAAAVPAPVAVRYAWASNPAGTNLYNREGLPANPFRTDTWPVVTQPSAAK